MEAEEAGALVEVNVGCQWDGCHPRSALAKHLITQLIHPTAQLKADQLALKYNVLRCDSWRTTESKP